MGVIKLWNEWITNVEMVWTRSTRKGSEIAQVNKDMLDNDEDDPQ